MSGNQSDFPFPEDITREILLRIPFESLLACKLVSKRLKNLINDPKFVNRYGNKSVALYFSKYGLYCLVTRYGLKISNDQFPPYTVHRIPIGLTEKDSRLKFLEYDLLSGSSNRIACVEVRWLGRFLFYNLFTGASYELTVSPRMKQPLLCFRLHGFGYDIYAEDYKLFMHYDSFVDAGVDADVDGFWVYSFRDKDWKEFKGFPGNKLYDWSTSSSDGFSLDGVLHWVVVTKQLEVNKRVAVTYDLHTGKFGEILLPTDGCDVGDKFCSGRLSEIDGKLCYVYQTKFSFCVWVMKEYGVRESWAILLRLDDLDTNILLRRMMDTAKPTMLYEREDGRKVVLFSGRSQPRLFWFDLDNNNVEEVDDSIW